MTSKRNLAIIGVLIAILASGYFFYWRAMAAQLEEGFSDWVEQKKAEGMISRFEWSGINGFPFYFEVSVSAADLHLPLSPNVSLDWSPPAFSLAMMPWDIQRMRLSFAKGGNHILSWKLQGKTPFRPLTISADKLDGDVVFYPQGRLKEILLSTASFKADFLDAGESDLTIAFAETPPNDYQGSFADLAFSGKNLRLPVADALPYGPLVDRASFEAQLMGPFGLGNLETSLREWSERGGTLELRHFSLAQQRFSVEGSATIALDEKLQPMGSGEFSVADLGSAFKHYADLGFISQDIAALAQNAVGAIEKPNGKGVKMATLPLSLQDRKLRFGPVTLLRMPKIDWSALSLP